MPTYRRSVVTITHWLPILTFCPVNHLPDFIFVSVTFNEFVELYGVRKRIKTVASGRKLFMEEIAERMSNEFPLAKRIEVRLMFGKHRVVLEHF